MQISILAEELKLIFLALSGREGSLVQAFCESCVYLDFIHSSVHMTRRFVIRLSYLLRHHLATTYLNDLHTDTFNFAVATVDVLM